MQPLLAASSSQGISVWERDADEEVGWEGWALEVHENVVNAIAFQPTTFLLASAAQTVNFVCGTKQNNCCKF